ncbi:hypothetical protein HK104_004451 [Borealophlyctis nickersoniae]|nr:hypothetical protein HK104_004451 [Borealophlyctis nickersoniae]
MSIRDVQLKIGMGLFFVGFLTANITSTISWWYLEQKNLVQFGNFSIVCSTFFIVAFVSQSFYSIRRTCMIYMLRPSLTLWLPIGVSLVQCAIQFTNGAFWAIDMQRYYGHETSPETQHATIASIIWILSSEPLFFGLLQYKIVKSATMFDRTPTQLKAVGLWIEAIVRLILYIAVVLITYLTVSDYLPEFAFWSCVNILPAMIGLIFLTDVMRFQRALGKGYNGESSTNSSTTNMKRFPPPGGMGGGMGGGPQTTSTILMASNSAQGVGVSSIKGDSAGSGRGGDYYGWEMGSANPQQHMQMQGGSQGMGQGMGARPAPAWEMRKPVDGGYGARPPVRGDWN